MPFQHFCRLGYLHENFSFLKVLELIDDFRKKFTLITNQISAWTNHTTVFLGFFSGIFHQDMTGMSITIGSVMTSKVASLKKVIIMVRSTLILTDILISGWGNADFYSLKNEWAVGNHPTNKCFDFRSPVSRARFTIIICYTQMWLVFLFERSVQVQKKFKLFGILDSFSTDQSVEIFITHADGFDVIDVFFFPARSLVTEWKSALTL